MRRACSAADSSNACGDRSGTMGWTGLGRGRPHPSEGRVREQQDVSHPPLRYSHVHDEVSDRTEPANHLRGIYDDQGHRDLPHNQRSVTIAPSASSTKASAFGDGDVLFRHCSSATAFTQRCAPNNERLREP